MVRGRTVIRYVGGIKDGREKETMAIGRDSLQEYKSSYIVMEQGVEVEKNVTSPSWDYDLPPNWIRCTYDRYKKVQDPDSGLIMKFIGSVERNRCNATTKKKTRCSRSVKGNSEFCHQHR
ncbi:hypothetical protein OFO16_07740 [Vibrio natriegens]|uniref:hypothetical protein n=1 Tax=Vibrio natriegens TaxID=691 RepID=UPI0021E85531|nr:hypothetical protein [Vibrio natriegens]UYI45762.1 hypothetical protein OFO16_07715 [Vibrio natriegens]UYI45767.1 hypothetical protein OFO16_07740 [Vibrio natriegens]